MNFHQGLLRLSVVVWGFLAFVIFAGIVPIAFGQNSILGMTSGIFACLGIAAIFFLICHGITKWLINGFFADGREK